MIFSSLTFIYFFLPITLFLYLITPIKYKNIILLIFSLIFYFLGDPKYLLVLIISSIINYYLSKLIYRSNNKKQFLIITILYNVGQLLIFKYTDFFISNINNIFNINIPLMYIIMPLGISFFTFQALGYVIDVYNNVHKPAKNLIEFMTYLTLFPQLIAGPIVRYKDVYKELNNRKISVTKMSEGIRRFVIGLSKKVMLANVLGEFVSLSIDETILSSWLKPIAYTLQIYFDFSGYSDMAIGLGLMFGFKFLENFNYPLIADSITNFWRRWHISLSSWFKDYLYIPLGGNKVNKFKHIRNIFIVWFLTGFWHGANWNFILWGLYFFVFLILEKFILNKYLEKTKILKYFYTLIIIVLSFMIFNSESVSDIFYNFRNMFMLNDIPFINKEIIYYFKSYKVLFIISIISATPLLKIIIKKINNKKFKKVINILEPFIIIILLTLTTAYLIDDSFNPFLYFRF